ncbi:hypothetical protein CZP2022_154 [Vibrio phage C-ZP2022]|nr:hypothetical protein CZP2022_154 [Vibrio phage C-ZP2022]
MRTPDFLAYQVTGKYIQGKVKRAGAATYVTGYNILNNDYQSEQLLKEIREGIQHFYVRMEQLCGSSVMTKYYEQMIDPSTQMGYDSLSEQMIPAVYETIIADTIRMQSGTVGVRTMPNVIQHAGELCWDWMCSFWYSDPNREPVSEEYKLDYVSRGERVRLEYSKLKAELLQSEGIHIEGLQNSAKKLAEISRQKAKPISLTQIAQGKSLTGSITMPNDEAYHFKHLDPGVSDMLDSQEREFNKKLELEARAKRTIEQLSNTTSVTTGGPAMGYTANMEQNTAINFKLTPEPETETMYNAYNPAFNTFNTAPQSILINFQNQPIVTAQGQTINVNPADMQAYVGGSLYQLQDNGQMIFDSEGMPIVIFRNQSGQEILVDLTGRQSAWFEQYRAAQQQQSYTPAAQQPAWNANQQQQPAWQVNQQQPATQPASNPNMDIPGMEFAMMANKTPAFETTAPSQDDPTMHLTGFEEYAVAPQPTTAPVEVEGNTMETPANDLGADYRFHVTIDGTDYAAALIEDEPYLPKEMAPLTVLVNNKTHARALAYYPDTCVEFVVNRERFMQREKHLGYILSSGHGEYTAPEAAPLVAENTGQCVPTFPKVQMAEEYIDAMNISGLAVQTAMKQATAADQGALIVSPFELREETPILNVADELLDELNAEDPLQGLLALYQAAGHAEQYDLCQYMTQQLSPLFTDVIYNRMGVPRATADMIEFPKDVSAVVEYLQSQNAMESFLEEITNIRENFFNISNEGISFTTDDDVEEDEDESEEPKAPKALAQMLVNEQSGHVAFLKEFQLPKDSYSAAIVDPVHGQDLWRIVAGVFQAIPTKPDRTEYLYLINAAGDMFVFACEDVDFGMVRLIGVKHK